jgi:glutamate-1-semialdehyde 2,1-aminomutase
VTAAAAVVSVLAAALVLPRLWARLELSLAKHPSLAGHPRLARRLARLVPSYEFDEAQFFRSDGAPDDVEAKRRAGFLRLAAGYRERYAATSRATHDLEVGISDLQFTAMHRVPFQYGGVVRRQLPVGGILRASSGVVVTDLDGNRAYDLSGSYGVNLLGYEFYKQCIERGVERARSLGPVLGPYHPTIRGNVERLRQISGLDEVSFHMSGTEAVMQAVRLARYHTGRSHLVRFAGAYHGWWQDVQPGVGSPDRVAATYTLRDMHEASLRVLRKRRDIACVLVNPAQALHPNANAPGDATLAAGVRRAGVDRRAYGEWLHRLRDVCRARGIVLIFDEVLVGFRLAPGGAQEYFGVRADMVTYGKTLGGGLPVGALCGRRDLMRRFQEGRPADFCFARGTFNSHPYVMAAMSEFLERLDSPEVRALYAGLDERWNARAERLNGRLAEAGLPVRVANLSSIWTVCYTQPSRYAWMLQYYLRLHGLALSWVGTGRLVFSLDYTEADFEEVAGRFVDAVRAMRDDQWWWSPPGLTKGAIERRILRETLAGFLRRAMSRTAASGDPAGDDGIDQLAAQQEERCAPVELDVVERVGQDLGEPDEAGLHVLREEEVHGPEQHGPDPQREPAQREVAHEASGARFVEQPKQRRV